GARARVPRASPGPVRNLQAGARDERVQPARAADGREVLRGGDRGGHGACGQGTPRGVQARRRHALRRAVRGDVAALADRILGPPAGAAFASEDERGIGHASLIPSRGSHLNIRTARKSPSSPQADTTATAPACDERASSSRKTARMSSRRYVSGRTSAIARRKAGIDSVDQKTPEMKTIGR